MNIDRLCKLNTKKKELLKEKKEIKELFNSKEGITVCNHAYLNRISMWPQLDLNPIGITLNSNTTKESIHSTLNNYIDRRIGKIDSLISKITRGR